MMQSGTSSNFIQISDAYVSYPDTPKEALDIHWFADYMDAFVAVDGDDTVWGTYIIKPKQIGLGNHIAVCS
jgi:hypothetical protein